MNKFFGENFQKLKNINRLRNVGSRKSIYKSDSLELSNISDHKIPSTVRSLTILDCENIKRAIQHFNSIDIQHELKNDQILLLRIHIMESFDEIAATDLEILNEKCLNKSIVILLKGENPEESQNNFLVYWKSRDLDKLLTLTSFNQQIADNNENILEFIIEFLSESLSQGKIGLYKEWQQYSNGHEVGAHLLADTRDYNLLLIAAEAGNAEIVQILLNCGANTVADDGVSAQDLAWNNRHSEVLLALAQANLPYPDGIDINQLSDDFKTFYKNTEELHAAIIEKNEEKVKEILNSGKNLEFYFDLSNKSAARVAVDAKAFVIYEILVIHEIFLAPHEYQQGIFDDLQYDDQKLIRELHHKHSKDLPDRHINILMSHSSIAHDVVDTEDKLKYVYQAYKHLSQDSRLSTILKVVAASKKFQIIYDFNRDAVNIADPTTSGNTEGVFYPMGRIYIGARQLLDETTRSQAIGTLAHELCHYAVNLTYCNHANPYKSNDNQTMQEFEEINEKCQKEKGKEEVVDLVHECYPVDMHHAELIVRPAHLIALYMDQPEKLAELGQTFPDLFNFFDKIIKEMEQNMKAIEEREKVENERKDKKISKLKRTLKYTAIFAIFMTVSLIAISVYPNILHNIKKQVEEYLYPEPFFMYDHLSETNKFKVTNAPIIYKNIEVRFHDLFPDNSTAYYKLTSDHISKIFDGQALNFSDSHFFYLNNLVHHDWGNLAGKLKEKFLTSNFTFQNESLKFQKLGGINSEVFDSLSSWQIEDVLDGKEIVVGKMIENRTEFYVERKFVFEGQQKNLRPKFFKNEREDIVDIIVKTDKTKLLILSSEAGAGKTVTFEHLAALIKKKYPTRWVSYVNLREHTELYKDHEKLLDVEGLMEEILSVKSKNKFELRIFQEFFKHGNVILLWNGFDEISPTYKDFMSNLLGNIYNKTQNVQYVCTRPLYSDFLQDLFQMKAYQLVPFTKPEQEEFLSKFFISQNVTGSKEHLIDKVINISQRLDFNTPLMLKMIAEIHDKPDLLESENLYEIYQSFVDKKVKIWQEKSEFAQNLSNSFLSGREKIDIIAIYQRFSLQLEIDFINVKKLEVMQTKIPKILPFEEISRMGILYVNNETEFAFAHKTFAEFFIAKYFIENIYEFDGDLKVEEAILRLEVLFYAYKRYAGMEIVSEFIKHYIKAQPTNEVYPFHPVIAKLLRTKFKSFLFDFLETRTPIVFDWMMGFFQKDRKLFYEMIQLNEPETLGTATLNPVYGQATIKFDNMKNFSKKYLNDREFQMFTSGRNQKGVIMFGLYFYKFFNFSKGYDLYKIPNNPIPENFFFNLFDTLKDNLTIPEQKELFIALSNPRNYRHFSTFNISSYDSLWTLHGHLLSHSETKNVLGDSVFGFIRDFYRARFTEYESVLHYLIDKIGNTLSDSEIFDIFRDKNLLHKAALHRFTLENLWNLFIKKTSLDQQKEILNHYDSSGKFLFYIKLGYINQIYDSSKLNILHLTLMYSQRDRLFMNYVLEMYTTRLNNNEMQDMILNSNDFLLYAIKYCDKFTSKDYTEYLEKLFEGKEDLLKELMDRKIERTDLNAVDYMKSLKAGIPEVFDIFNDMYDRVASRATI